LSIQASESFVESEDSDNSGGGLLRDRQEGEHNLRSSLSWASRFDL